MVEESYGDIGSLKIDRAWSPLELFTVVKEGEDHFLELSPRITSNLLSQATTGRYVIGVSIFGREDNKAYFIDELIRLTNKQQMPSDRNDPKGVRIWPVTGTIDGKQIAIMFLIGESSGKSPHDYEVKIMEACLSLCHIGLLNVHRTIGNKEIYQLQEAFAKVKNEHVKQLTNSERPLYILGRDAKFVSSTAQENPTAEEGESTLKILTEIFPQNRKQYIQDINVKEWEFKKDLVQFSGHFTSYLRQVIDIETDGKRNPNALSFDSFWKVMKSFKKRPSESEEARRKFKASIEDEMTRVIVLIEKRDEDNSQETIKEFKQSFDAKLLQMRDQWEKGFGDCEVKLEEAFNTLNCRFHSEEAAELERRMTKIKKSTQDEIENLQDDLDEIEEKEELDDLERKVDQMVKDARDQISIISKEGKHLAEVLPVSDNLIAGLFRSDKEMKEAIKGRRMQLKQQKAALVPLEAQEIQFLKAMQDVKFRGLSSDPFLWKSLDYRVSFLFSPKKLTHPLTHSPTSPTGPSRIMGSIRF